MAGYSKESERQNQALKDLMSGNEHKKQYIQVGYEGKKSPQGDKISRLSEVMKEARMPWFCPECEKVMKSKLDNKFWSMTGHCFDCQVSFENKLRISGEYENYENSKILENRKAHLHDLKQSIDEFEERGGKAEFFNNVGVDTPELEAEDWSMGEENFDKMVKEARDHIATLELELENEEKTITV